MHNGSCLCGNITYTVDRELSEFGYCHCTSCRKASGSAYGANAGTSKVDFKLSDPNNSLREFESSPGKFRAFCSNCGSPLYAYLSKSPELIRIRLGTLDSTFSKQAAAHTFVSDKATWESIEGNIPQFDQWASKDVLIQPGSRQPK